MQSNRKARQGIVISGKMDKTVVVAVVTTRRHRLYQKRLRRTNHFYAHDERNECRLGDTVSIRETRPLSKLKRWEVIEIIRKGDVADVQPRVIGAELERPQPVAEAPAAVAAAVAETPVAAEPAPAIEEPAAVVEAPVEQKPKRATRAKTEEPAAEAPIEDAKPKRTARAKKTEAPAAEAPAEDAKPKGARAKKTKAGED